jgi:hypothetical protein
VRGERVRKDPLYIEVENCLLHENKPSEGLEKLARQEAFDGFRFLSF